jgi:steroid 5-alpha reductase family enzyme
MLQGFLLLVIDSPALFVNSFGGPALGWLDIAGVALWFSGFLMEAVADYQLMRFMKDPANRGRILQAGLWRYSRHPNYFGEVSQWWGLWLIALSVPGGWVTVFGPLAITILILKVSGIPLLESRQTENPEYREYRKRTSAFVPWLPKKVDRSP